MGERSTKILTRTTDCKIQFMKNANITEIVYSKMTSGFWQVEYFIGNSDDTIQGEGKTLVEADLDAILNYSEKSNDDIQT